MHDLRELSRPLLVVVGGACLLVATEPDLGTAMAIAFTTVALLVAAGIPVRNLAIVAGRRVRARRACTRSRAPTRARG